MRFHATVFYETQDFTAKEFVDNLRENWFSHLILLIYTVLIFVVISVHEPWADEAQAWLLARDSNLFDLMFKNLRYEGHPGLWYLILVLPSKLLPYRAISILSGLIAIAGVFVLLYYSPFPKIIKLLLPFSYFIFYQYGVIARSYVLLPILFFLIASVYQDKTTKIYQFTILVCLLAFTSVYTALVAISIMLIHLIDLIRSRSDLNRELIIKQIKAYLGFAFTIALIIIQLWQPEDSSFATTYNFDIRHFFELSSTVLNKATTEVKYLSAFVLILSLIWFWRRKLLLLYLISTLSVLALFSTKYYNSWHQGIIFLVWVFVMWVSFEKQKPRQNEGKFTNVIRKLVIISFLIVLGFHVFWAGSVSISDYRGPYSAAKDAVEYIKANNLGNKKSYATSFWTTAILPYFDENIFDNHNNGKKPAFWFWRKDNRRIENIEIILQAQPDLIIIGRPSASHRAGRLVETSEITDYKFVGVFHGNLYWKNGIKEKNDFALFRELR